LNYGEEAAYWYLRLNGFFPITNFVLHAGTDVAHTSECDVLGVRPPYVYEEIGGQSTDWDPFLVKHLRFDRPVGIICEVKTGGYKRGKLFRKDSIEYSVRRLGLVGKNEASRVAHNLRDAPLCAASDGTLIGKLLVARQPAEGPFLYRDLGDIRRFLDERVAKYPKQKVAGRMFFGPGLFQFVIETMREDL
jgi:hypothetical protein